VLESAPPSSKACLEKQVIENAKTRRRRLGRADLPRQICLIVSITCFDGIESKHAHVCDDHPSAVGQVCCIFERLLHWRLVTMTWLRRI